LPSLFFLLALQRKKEEFVFSKKRALPYLLVLIFLLVVSVFYIWSINPVLSEIFVPLLKGRWYAPDYTLFSFPHIVDVINQHLLLSPVGLILLLSLIIAYKNRILFRNPTIVFLLIIFLAQVSYHFIIDPKLGAGRDWDLLSNIALGYTLLGVYLFISLAISKSYSLVALIFTAFLCTLPWFMVNANTERAIRRYSNLLDVDSKKSLTGRWTLANYYYQQNRITTVKELNAETFKLFPEDSLTRAAETYMRLSNYDKAVDLLKKAIGINPNFVLAHNKLGIIYLIQQRSDEAYNEFQKIVRLSPFNSVFHVNLGIALLRKERLKEALAQFKKAEKLGGIEPDAYCEMAYIHFRLGEIEEAIKTYKKAFKIDPEFYKAHFELGQIYLERNSLSEALVEFDQVVRIKPDYDLVYYHLGLVYAYKGMKEKAIEEFELFLSLSKDQTQNQQVRGWIQRLQSQKP
jgi:tetratricopeptide (TPR) repeat protein